MNGSWQKKGKTKSGLCWCGIKRWNLSEWALQVRQWFDNCAYDWLQLEARSLLVLSIPHNAYCERCMVKLNFWLISLCSASHYRSWNTPTSSISIVRINLISLPGIQFNREAHNAVCIDRSARAILCVTNVQFPIPWSPVTLCLRNCQLPTSICTRWDQYNLYQQYTSQQPTIHPNHGCLCIPSQRQTKDPMDLWHCVHNPKFLTLKGHQKSYRHCPVTSFSDRQKVGENLAFSLLNLYKYLPTIAAIMGV